MEHETSLHARIAHILQSIRTMIDTLERELGVKNMTSAPLKTDGADRALKIGSSLEVPDVHCTPSLLLCTYKDLKSNDRATAQSRVGLPEDEVIAQRAGRLVERYRELYTRYRAGARMKSYRTRPAIDWQEACSIVETWDDATLEKLMVIVLTTDEEWISHTDRSFKVFCAKASWADDRLKQWEARRHV